MNDLLPGTQVQGTINAAGNDVYAKETNVDALRRQVGMIEQKPNPLPMTIYDNVAFGLRLQGIQDKNVINAKVTQALMDAG
ncbi:phosphate ABC transporter ATP-binding protein, partial [Streptomyces turgidiscabies]